MRFWFAKRNHPLSIRQLIAAFSLLSVILVLVTTRQNLPKPRDFYSLLASLNPLKNAVSEERLRDAIVFELEARLALLKADNNRLRSMLDLQRKGRESLVSAPVISRYSNPWKRMLLGRGSRHGLCAGDPVFAPGGLIGRLDTVSVDTSTVRLLVSPGSVVGVWLPRSRISAVMTGLGAPKMLLQFIDYRPDVRPGDLISTSPASTLLPPNVPVGIVVSVSTVASPGLEAVVRLNAPVDEVDWVQVSVENCR